MFKRKLFKRALPVILSVAMVFQSMPATALAAENDQQVVETEAAGTEESTSDVEDMAKDSENEPEKDNKETPEESGTQSSSSVTEEPGSQDSSSAEEEPAGTGAVASEPDVQPESTDEEAETNVEISADDETGSDTVSLDAKITVNVNDDIIEGFTPVIDPADPDAPYKYTTTYTEEGRCGAFQTTLKNVIEITVNGDYFDTLKENLTYEWQQNTSTDADGKPVYTKMAAGLPVNAGKYLLKISLPAAPELCNAASVDIYVEIEKAQINLNLEDCLTVKRGTTVADFKKQIAENYKLETIDASDPDNIVTNAVGKEIVKEAPAVLVYQVGADAALGDDVVLDAANDYTVKVGRLVKNGDKDEFEPVLTLVDSAAQNYTVEARESYNIEIGELQPTKIVFELADPGKEIIKEYTGSQVAIADLEKEIFPKDKDNNPVMPQVYVVDEDGKETLLTVKDGEETKPVVPEAGWYTRRQPLTDGSSDYIYTKLDADPKEAGEYFVRYTYADETNVYEKSESDPIRVVIDPAPAVITIDNGEGKLPAFYENMTAADARKALAELSYNVLAKSKKGEGENAADVQPGDKIQGSDADDFFGVSYEGDDNTADKTQYYKPVFKLQRRVCATLGEDGKFADIKPEENTNSWNDVTYPIVKQTESRKYEFRIIFTGNKAVFKKDGSVNTQYQPLSITETSTNSANKNYLVDISDAILEKYAVAVDVTQALETTINTDAIVDAFREAYKDNNDYVDDGENTFFNPAVKIYDAAPLFNKRADYKKAAVMAKAEEAAEAADIKASEDELEYTWEYTPLESYENYIKEYNAMTAEEQLNASYNENYWYDYNDNTLDNRNDDTITGMTRTWVYKLNITYTDKTDDDKAYKTSSADVYFKVEKQEIVIVPGPQIAQREQEIASWQNNGLNKSGYKVYKIPKNNKSEYENATDKSSLEINGLWNPSITFKVKRGEKDAAGKDTGVYVANDHSNFTEGYNYGVTATYGGSGQDYTTIDKANSTAAETKQHEEVTPINWYEGRLYVEIDKDKIQSMTKTYDKVSIESLPEGAIKLYSDEAKTVDVTAEMLNTTAEYDPAKVNVFWQKWNYNDDGDLVNDGVYYPTSAAIYGGTYTLALYFEGSKPSADESTGDTPAKLYQPFEGKWMRYTADDAESFIIKPKDITIAPKLNEKAKAGDHADTLLLDELEKTDLIKDDEQYFTYTENTNVSIDKGSYVVDSSGMVKSSASWSFPVNNQGGYYAFDGINGYRNAWYKIQIDDKDIKYDAYSYYLRTGRKYTAKLANGLAEPFASSYNVTWGAKALTITNRGEAEVEGSNIFAESDRYDSGYTDLRYDYASKTYTIRPREAVRFYYAADYNVSLKDIDDNVIPLDRNMIAYRIYAPKEFEGRTNGENFDAEKESFIYEKAIKAAGGYILNDWVAEDNEDQENDDIRGHYLTVLFPLTESDKDKKSFNITWEEGYTDTFKLADAVLEADLTNAVAPKKIAFNGVVGKMAVGETQPLDVKITKAQLGDIIKLRYRIKGGATSSTNISIDPETGVVTALKAGKQATIVEAYPVHRNENGELVEITGKGVKTATTKITVTEVSAPAVKNITNITDVSAKVNYTPVANGYRREIYLLDITGNTAAKKWKAKDIESKVKAVKNGQFDKEFVSVNYKYNETVDEKTKLAFQSYYNLEPNKTYMVYVRNVSAARTLDDGSVVDLSAAGTVKSFTTTKSQVQSLGVIFDTQDAKSKVKYEKGGYTIALSDKSAQVTVYGYFREIMSNNKAEQADEIRYRLAPKSELNKKDRNYLLPKLGYVVLDARDNDFEEHFVNNKFTGTLSKYATVNKSGKITLKGVDLDGTKTVYIYVYDVSDPEKNDYVALTITASADKVTGRKAKLKVGDTISLSDYLDYKDAKKKKVPNYRSSYVMISDAEIARALENGYSIEKWYYEQRREDDENDEPVYAQYGNNWLITAVSPNKKPFKLEITDILNGKTEKATVTLTSAALDPVKGLKVSYVDDKNITINFTHAGNPEAFAIEVKDGRGSIVEKRLAWNSRNEGYNSGGYDFIESTNDKSVKEMQQWIQYKFSYENNFKYYAKSKIYAYTINSEKLVRLSNYTITVTPVYETQTAKPVSKKVKTTNIPASRENVNVMLDNAEIEVGGTKTLDWSNYSSLASAPYWFTSGNTYTLRLSGDDVSRDRVTDTLTWKSSNTKVATVKANPGTYTATFKAVKAGDTTLTVTSKVTKKVIARYDLRVKTVGNGSGYGGDYEHTWDDTFYRNILAKWDPYYTRRLEVLTLSNKVVLGDANKTTQRDYTWISFTAPSFGEYTFSFKDRYDYNMNLYVYDGRTGSSINGTNQSFMLEAGQKVYLRVLGTGTVSVSGTAFARLTAANDSADTALTVKNNEWVSFTAPENNYYTFAGTTVVTAYKNNTLLSENSSYSLAAGETIFLKVNGGTMYVTFRKTDASTTLDLTNKKKIDTTFTKDDVSGADENGIIEKVLKFTAPVTADYTFTTETSSGVTVTLRDANDTELSNGGRVETEKTDGQNAVELAVDAETETLSTQDITVTIEKGCTVFVCFTLDKNEFGDLTAPDNTAAAKTFKANVTVSTPEIASLTGTATVTKNTTKVFSYTVPSDGKYIFSVTDGSIDKYVDSNFETLDMYDSIVVDSESSIKAGDTIYLYVTASEEKDASVSVTKIGVTSVNAEKTELTVKNGGEYWYSFTAKQAGNYTFKVEKKDADGKHTPSLEFYDKAFDGDNAGTPSDMRIGRTVYFKVAFEEVPEDTAGTAVIITISRTPEEEQLILNTAKNVKLAKAGDTAAYEFTALDADTYTVTWTPTQTSGAATVNRTTLSASRAGQTFTITVTADADNVDGTLKVTSAKASAEPIVSKTAGNFNLKAGESKQFRFTVPAEELIGYEILTTVKAGSNAPTVTAQGVNWDDPWEIGEAPYECGNFGKGEVITFTVTAPGDKTSEGSLLIQPITAEPLTAKEVEITNAKDVWFTYTVSEYGRYDFDIAPEAIVYMNGNGDFDGEIHGDILQKGDSFYIRVHTDKAEKTKVALKMPTKITAPAKLTTAAEGTKVTIAAGKYAYYEFTAGKYAEYTFANTAADGKNTADRMQYSVEGEDGEEFEDLLSVTLKNGETIFIRMHASEAAEFTCKVTEKVVNVLTVDNPAPITLEKDASIIYEFTAYEKGMYTFKTTDMPADANLSVSKSSDQTAYERYDAASYNGGFYFVKEYMKSNTKETITITNNGAAQAKFKLVASKVAPIVVESGVEKLVGDVKQNEAAWITFTVPAKDRYTFTTSDAKLKVFRVNGGAIKETVLNTDGQKITYRLTSTEAEIKAAKVTIAPVKPQEIKNNSASFEIKADGDSAWFEYTTTAGGEYTFKVKKDAAEVPATIEGFKKVVPDAQGSNSINLNSAMAKDKKIYVKISNLEAGNYTLTVDVNAYKELTTGKEEPLAVKKGDFEGVIFKASKAGKYVLTVDNEESVDIERHTDGFVMNDGSVLLNKDQVAYWLIRNDNGAETENVKVTLSGSLYSTQVEFEKYSDKIPVEFTVPENGDYVVTAVIFDNNDGDFRVSYTGNNELDNKWDSSDGFSYINVYSSFGNSDNPVYGTIIGLNAGDKIPLSITPWSYSEGNDNSYNHTVTILIDKVTQ